MKTIREIRRENARKLRDSAGGNSSFAALIDREATQTSRFMGENATKNIGDDLARHIENCFNMPLGWLDKEHQTTNVTDTQDVTITSQQIAMVPVISWVQAGAWTEVGYSEVDLSLVETFPCPVPCGPMTYILRVIGDSMIDEYRPGDMIFVDPEICATNGDDVIALMHDTGETTFKRLIEDGGKKYLKALNKNWPEQYITINGKCSIIGTVIFSGKPRRYRTRN
ncbi:MULTISPECIES: LexA family protein [Enterobacterales]|jgi:SOS-response transcriptional repressor LexA|uniref:LexA family transcriptional regulator n=2 Tax=Hafnia TaxID=568 RepID=A0A2A2M9S6_9GAMM|nr:MULTISPECIES: LexA family transcriptional regulator [Enterobacterales]MDN6019250.1 LexA family transcriptional regulator [Enterobacterales bacterium]EHM39302.1 peptidase S24-like protein [Hafnia alvei ATCC 51873]EHP5272017.1 LexA family transcriptional regulator [Escherichia coli]KAA0264824.1 LexA family transcriptional regulator [Hafnia alvei]MBW2958075.1 LexA family transcriptional regulator [Hafnia paralvei]